MLRVLFATGLIAFAAPVHAQCEGENLIAALPAAQMADLRAATDAVPYPVGNFWRATRGTQIVHVIGTYHFDDPRHAATMAKLDPLIAQSTTVLVEAGPREEAALIDRMAADPSVLLITEGPTLPEILPPEDWKILSDAVRERGIPPFMAAKFRPWYLSMLLGIPACQMATAAESRGLDGMVIDAAEAVGVPVKALEPYDTLFGLFETMSAEDQVSMIQSTLALGAEGEDFAITLADSYFAEEGRMIWEFMRMRTLDMPGYTPERVEAEFATMETVLMTDRNRNWIPVILAEADNGPVVAAFGALHLSGPLGVLSLLAAEGFTLTRLPF